MDYTRFDRNMAKPAGGIGDQAVSLIDKGVMSAVERRESQKVTLMGIGSVILIIISIGVIIFLARM